MKKIAFILAVLMLLASITVACTPGDGKKENSGKTTDTDLDNYEDAVPTDLKYNGYNFVIAFPTPAESAMNFQIIEDGAVTSQIDSAVYNRNMKVQERFGITLEGVLAGQSDTQVQFLSNMCIAGDDEFDLAQVAFTFSGIPWMMSGYAADWQNVDYVDLSRPYWSSSMTENISVKGHSFLIQGKINWTSAMSTQVCFFNTTVATDNNVENLYTAVEDGSWTFDKLRTIAKGYGSKDLNNDNIYDENDQYGIIQSFYGGMYNWSIAADYKTVLNEEDGLKLNYSTKKFSNIIDYVYDLLYNDKTAYVEKFDFPQDSKGIRIFFEDRALFMFTDLGHADYFRAETSDYGIIPTPKYDENQAKYCTTNDQWGLSCAIPNTATNPSRTGAITEVLCALSGKSVYPVYYDVVLSERNTRDEESHEMLDLIFSNIVFDTGITLAKFETYIPLCYLMNPNKPSTNIASWVEKFSSKLNSEFEALYSYMAESADNYDY